MARGNFEVDDKERKKRREWKKFSDLILFEDDRVLVVNKPPGVSSLEDRGTGEPSLLDYARKHYPNIQLCHRLDKMTSGAILMAKTKDVYRDISILFAEREVIKFYVAVVHGTQDFEEFMIEAPIAISSKGNRAKINMLSGKEALTVVETAEKFRHYTLVNCHPVTGRLHQIRVHMAFSGYPLIGDSLYGGADVYLSDIKRTYKLNRSMEEKPIHEGFLLHARGIQLTLPGDEEESTFIAPLWKNFDVALKILRKYDT